MPLVIFVLREAEEKGVEALAANKLRAIAASYDPHTDFMKNDENNRRAVNLLVCAQSYNINSSMFSGVTTKVSLVG